MLTSSKSNDRWEVCPAGQLRQLAADLAAQYRLRNRNMLVGRAVTAGLLFVLVGGIAFWSTLPRHLGGLSCAECRSHFAAYHEQLVSDQPMLSDGLFQQIEYHLDHCESCRSHFSKLYPEALAWIGPASCLANPTAGQAHAAILLAVAGL